MDGTTATVVYVLSVLAAAMLPACGQEKPCPVACPAPGGVLITNATTHAAVCDATVLEMLPDGGTKMLPVYGSEFGEGPVAEAGCSYSTFDPSESVATVTISAPGLKSTTVTITYNEVGACCSGGGFSPGQVALVPQ